MSKSSRFFTVRIGWKLRPVFVVMSHLLYDKEDVIGVPENFVKH